MSYLQSQRRLPRPEIVSRYLGAGDNIVDSWSPERLEAYQAHALREVVGHAYEHNEFYRQRFTACDVRPHELDLPRDIARLPILRKDDLRGNPWRLLAVERAQLSQITVSTGTTGGAEIYVPQTWEDMYVRTLEPIMQKLIPVGRDDVVLNALPYDMSSAGLAFHRSFQRARGALVVAAGKGGHYSTPESAARLAADLGATIVLTGPSYAMLIAEAAAQLGIDLKKLPLRFLWLTGEGCSPAFRERIEAAWGHPAYFYYGSLEAGPLGVECSAKAGYHIASGHIYAEIVHPESGEVLPPGTAGEVVITALTRLGAPLIRYNTQDIATLDLTPCACGVTIPRLLLKGRAVDQITVAGRSYSPYYVEELLMRIPGVSAWYEIIVERDAIQVRVEPANSGRSGGLRQIVETTLRAALEIPVNVELTTIARTGGKVERVKKGAQ